mmetsp:Transcript_135/g.460  ORF Transcript_135/g.460 Transcript_135/m.460 type:complete len:292 (-) Transcript_135:9-884(-)
MDLPRADRIDRAGEGVAKRPRAGEAEHMRAWCCSMAACSRAGRPRRGVELQRLSGVDATRRAGLGEAPLLRGEAWTLRERGRNSVCSVGPRGTVSSGFHGPEDFDLLALGLRREPAQFAGSRLCGSAAASPVPVRDAREARGVLRLNSCGTVSVSCGVAALLCEGRESTLSSGVAWTSGVAAYSEAPMLRGTAEGATLRWEAAQACREGSRLLTSFAGATLPPLSAGERFTLARGFRASARPRPLSPTSTLSFRMERLTSAFSSFLGTAAAGMLTELVARRLAGGAGRACR